MGKGTKVGQSESEIVTTKDLLVRLQSPRFFVEKDEVVLFGFESKDLCRDVLDGVEKFAVAGKKKGRICAGKLDAD